MNVIDLRSDTVTLPTQQMREAMYSAELGDDVHQDDPTIKRLERMAAKKMGKEDALFVASGTMGNLVAVLTHCEEGDRVVVGSESHIHHYEGDGIQRLVDVVFDPLPNDAEGRIDAAALDEELWEGSTPSPTLVCLENTHMRCGGVPITAEYTSSVADVAHERATPLHLDGARIFNAAVALDVDAAELAAPADSVMFCLSKGLSCPVGSVLCGTGEFIVRARQSRRWVGGGMRQLGVLGAAGIVALETMIDRLAEDHANAWLLARGLSEIPGIGIDPERVKTNIIVFGIGEQETKDFLTALTREGVLALPIGPGTIRMVTHYGISRQDIERALSVIERATKAGEGVERVG